MMPTMTIPATVTTTLDRDVPDFVDEEDFG
jgi:hypothetical protein